MDVNVNPAYPLFPVFAFMGFVLVLIPLPWHIQIRNVGTCAYIFWASVACLFQFINSVVWRNNALNLAPVWCDITSKFCLGAGVGIPAAGLCLSRQLYAISTIQTTSVTKQDKCRAVVIDSCIAFGIPILVMALHYVVQGHRFDILEDIGCYPAIYNTLPAYFLVSMWPILLGCISFVFSCLTLRAIYKQKSEFSRYLATHTPINMSGYIRLMTLAVSEMSCTVPISVYSTYIANKGVSLQPWISWSDTHYNFSHVDQIAAFEWISDANYRVSVELTRWLFPASALLFFALFGFALDLRKYYRTVFLDVGRLFGYKPAFEGPVHVQRRWQAGSGKRIYVGSIAVDVSDPSSHDKRDDALMPSAAKCFDVDVEKLADGPSPSFVSSDSPRDHQPSPFVVQCTEGEDISESRDVVTEFPSVAVRTQHRQTVPAYYHPFSLPVICPTAPHRTLQSTRSLDNVRISVHTEYSIAL
ncbi:putative fungal pheromone GPCR, STE3-type [Chiua virens]|nr:putative fungal pheromone GPCR, STE3-type [Chiua virens]